MLEKVPPDGNQSQLSEPVWLVRRIEDVPAVEDVLMNRRFQVPPTLQLDEPRSRIAVEPEAVALLVTITECDPAEKVPAYDAKFNEFMLRLAAIVQLTELPLSNTTSLEPTGTEAFHKPPLLVDQLPEFS